MTQPGTAQAALDCAHGRQSLLSGGACAPWWRLGAGGHPALSPCAGPCEQLHVPATVQAVLAARSTACRRRRSASSRLLPLLAPRCHCRCSGIAECPRRPCTVASDTCRPQSSCMRPVFPSGPILKHALTHEVAYGSLLLERRRALHARIVEALEALRVQPGGRSAVSGAKDLPTGRQKLDQVERLAHHAVRGEVWAKARHICQQAGAMAHDRTAFHEAVAAFEQALQALQHLPGGQRYSRTGRRAPPCFASLAGRIESYGGVSPCWVRAGEAWLKRSTIGLGWDECLAGMAQVHRTKEIRPLPYGRPQAFELGLNSRSALQVYASLQPGASIPRHRPT